MKTSFSTPSHYRDESYFPSGYREAMRWGSPENRKEMITRILQRMPVRNMGAYMYILEHTYGGASALRGIQDVGGSLRVSETLSFAAVQQKIVECASRLRLLGLKPGDRMGIAAENSVNEHILKNACLRQGIVVVPWTREVDDAGMQMSDVMELSNIHMLAYSDCEFVRKHLQDAQKDNAHPALAALLKDEKCIRIGNEIGDMRYPGGLESQLVEDCPYENVDGDHPALLMYSSGTGGAAPKQIMVSHANLVYQCSVGPAVMDQPTGSNCLHVLPFYHIFGEVLEQQMRSAGQMVTLSDIRTLKKHGPKLLQITRPQFVAAVPEVFSGIHLKIENGMREVIERGDHAPNMHVFARLQSFFARQVRELLQKEMRRVARENLAGSQKIGGPVHEANTRYWASLGVEDASSEDKDASALSWFDRRLISKVLGKSSLDRLDFAINGGGAISASDVGFFRALGQGGVRIVTGYGLTETTGGVFVPSAHGRDPAVTSGKLLPGMAAWTEPIADPAFGGDSLHEEICIAGPAVARYTDVNAQNTLVPGGVLHTGDLGSIHQVSNGTHNDVHVLISGRRKRMIKFKGTSILPEQIESILSTSPLIQEVMVVGNDHDRLGALVVPSGELLAMSQGDATRMREALLQEIQEIAGRGRTHQRGEVSDVCIVSEFPENARTPSRKLIPPAVYTAFSAQIERMWSSESVA